MLLLVVGREEEVGGDEDMEGVRLFMTMEPGLSAGLTRESVVRVSMPKVGRVVMTPGATPLTPERREAESGEYMVGILTMASWMELRAVDAMGAACVAVGACMPE